MLLRHQAVVAPAQAAEMLGYVCAHPRHHFWPDALNYTELSWMGILGHRQVTDAYLAALTRHYQGRLVTFDKWLAALHSDVAVLLPA